MKMNVKTFAQFTPLGSSALTALRGGSDDASDGILPDAAGGGRKRKGKGKEEDILGFVDDVSRAAVRGDRD